jgi:GntR family transcriptional regulator/MocR family aminotransferase
MSPARRRALLSWAAESGAWILEDDYDSEYRYAGPPIPTLQGSDRHGRVILAGTFDKVLFPALRLGYLVVPSDVAERFIAARSSAARQASGLTQVIVADFMTAGHFGRHLRRMREVYAERATTLQTLARRMLAGGLEVPRIEAGFHVAARILGRLDATTVSTRAAALGVETVPVARYALGDSAPYAKTILLGFAATGPREMRRGFECLARVLE